MKRGICPYCGAKGKKLYGSVVRNSTHLAFGWGEKRYACGSCGEEFSWCYSIPPKWPRKDFEKPNPDILKVSFKEGVDGYADHVPLKVSMLPFVIQSDASPELQNSGDGDGH